MSITVRAPFVSKKGCTTSRMNFTRAWIRPLGIRWAQGWNKVPKQRQLRHSMWVRLGNDAKPVRPQFIKVERYGKLWWTCPKCRGSYGEVFDDIRKPEAP